MIDGPYTTTKEVHGEEVFLDLNKVRILGFHKGVDKKDVESLIEAISKDAVFPPVKVVRSGEKIFSLAFLIDSETGKPDGGHHRAYAHYLAGKKLRCEIVPFCYLAQNAKIAIQDLVYRE